MNDTADIAYIKAFFHKHAPIYDLVTFPFRTVQRKVLPLVPPGPQVKVLDVATVTGLDLSPDMLRVARGKNKYPNATFTEGDATALPHENASFDAVHISFALHDMPPDMRLPVLKEMARVTRPGGTVIIVDYFLPARGLRRWFAYNFVKSIDSKYYPSFVNLDLNALIREAGVTITAERHAFFGMVTIVSGTV